MARKIFLPLLFLALASQVQSATFIEKSYEYVVNFGKSIAPSLISIWDCMGQEEAWSCAREKAGKILDGWDVQVKEERRSWQEQADAEVSSSGRSFEELPSKLGREVEGSLASLSEILANGVARALSKKHDSGGGIDSITISTGSGDKKPKKKKQKPAKIHLIHPVMMAAHKEAKGRGFPNGRQTWVIGSQGVDQGVDKEQRENEERDAEDSHSHRNARVDSQWDENDQVDSGVQEVDAEDSHSHRNARVDSQWDENDQVDSGVQEVDAEDSHSHRNARVDSQWEGNDQVDSGVQEVDQWGVESVARGARGVMADMWSVGQEALDVLADAALEAETKDNGVQDKSSFEEQRGKKKKKKKAILKLLILGAVLKAKIGTLLQILSFKLQVKFFIVAVLGLAINLARLWIDLKNKHNHQPQKVIYYEHAQHQHHYDHEEEHESPGWGPWSRSMEPEESDVDVDVDLQNQNTPYRGQARNPHLAYMPRTL